MAEPMRIEEAAMVAGRHGGTWSCPQERWTGVNTIFIAIFVNFVWFSKSYLDYQTRLIQLEIHTEQAEFVYPSCAVCTVAVTFQSFLAGHVYSPLKDPSCFRSEVARLSSQLPVSQASELRPQPSPARPVSRCQDPLVCK